MTWEVLHAGKFVDAEGIVLDRAEHEFIAASPGLPESARRAIVRDEPPRQTPVAWAEGFFAAMQQLVMPIDGQDFVVRVIDHRAFEGSADRPGRAYRRRTYLLKPCIDWDDMDAILPISVMQTVPDFETFGTVQPWQARASAASAKDLAADLGALLAGRLHIDAQPSIPGAARLSMVLASLPPQVACRVSMSIGKPATLSLGEGAATPPRTDIGQPWLDVLKARNVKLQPHAISAAARQLQHVVPLPDPKRPFEALREQIAWNIGVEAWVTETRAKLAANQPVPTGPVAPSIAALRAVLPSVAGADAPHLLGCLGEPAWGPAWAQIGPEEMWPQLARLLGKNPLDEAHFVELLRMDLQGPTAQSAADALLTPMASLGGRTLHVLLTTKAAWAVQFRRANRAPTMERILQIIRRPDDHAFWRAREGRALQRVLDAQATEADVATLQGLPIAGWLAAHGSAKGNACWWHLTGQAGDPGNRNDGVAACLQLLRGEPVVASGIQAAWPTWSAPLPVAAALNQGVDYDSVAAARPHVTVEPAAQTVAALLGQQRFDPNHWRSLVKPQGPWALLWMDSGQAPDQDGIDALQQIPDHQIPSAAHHYKGIHPAAWKEVSASGVFAWLCGGGPPEWLASLAGTAPLAVATALEAWSRKTQSTHRGAATVRARLQDQLNWTQRRHVRRDAKQLEIA